MEKKQPLLLILGNQLFPYENIELLEFSHVYMAESIDLCTYYRFHKHKIIFFLAAMRQYADSLRDRGVQVQYNAIDQSDDSYEETFLRYCRAENIFEVIFFEIEDKFFESRLTKFLEKSGISYSVRRSPMFFCARTKFKEYLSTVKKPFMKTFYEKMRRETGFLMDSNGRPFGGKFSFDAENRKRLPKKIQIPNLPQSSHSKYIEDVKVLVDENFSDHPGQTSEYWIPTGRKDALSFLNDFVNEKLEKFGPYQDALSSRGDTLFHSILSPYLNAGLLTPKEVLDSVVAGVSVEEVPEYYSSVEGFVRQVLGWREFVRGIYQNFSETQSASNFFEHDRELNNRWYTASTGILPLDLAIDRTIRTGYSHHIERLMVLGNMMVLCEIRPEQAHRWFMEMYVDSSDWVMGPNVYGMGIFSDGGIFATKPYICGANYIKKMSDYPKGSWELEMTALYWRFVGKNLEYLRKNFRCIMITRIYDRFSAEKQKDFESMGDDVISRLTN